MYNNWKIHVQKEDICPCDTFIDSLIKEHLKSKKLKSAEIL